MSAILDIETLAAWSAPKEVQTRMGRRLLRKAQPTEEFSAAWKAGKDALKAAGLSWSKDERTGQWEVCWWQPLDTATVAKENAAVEASRKTSSDFAVPVPEGLTLMPFQRAGVEYMMSHPSTLLADSMGLGKTVQSIGLINCDPTIKRVLVVCPASLKVNWRNELNKWLTRPLRVGVQNAGEPWCGSLCDVVVLNYDILGKYPAIYAGVWDLLVADESHYLKSRGAKRTKLLLGAFKKQERDEFPGVKATRRVFATGTPVLNRPVELFPLLEALQPGKWTFKDKIRYCNGTQGRWGWDFSGASHLDELQMRLRRDLMCRRLKSEVLTELPAKRRQVIEIAANGASGAVAEEHEQFRRHEDGLTTLKARAEVARLADDEEGYKAAVEELRNAYRVAFTEMAKVRRDVAVAKVPKVLEHVRNVLEDAKKLVLFVHHHDVTDAMVADLAEFGVEWIDGRTANEDRQPTVDRFNTDPAKRVLVLGIRAAGVGLSVKASVEVFAELDWTPGIVAQAEDRCHGIGRGIEGEPLLVQHLVLEGSLDAKMAKTIVAKQEIADKALDKNGLQSLGAEPVLTVTLGSVLEASEEKPASLPQSGPENAPTGLQTPANHVPVSVSDALREHVHAGLRALAGCDHDRARELNGVGFNKFDTEFGCQLADRSWLTDGMVRAGLKLLRKYRRQLGDDYRATSSAAP